MEYNLSQEYSMKKEEFENAIAQNNKKYLQCLENIKRIRQDKNKTLEEKSCEILEIQIEQEEISRDTDVKKGAIVELYIRQMQNNLIELRKNREISAEEYSNGMDNIREYKAMYFTNGDIEDYDIENTILEMKIKLETRKRNIGKVSKEHADINIKKMKQEMSANEEYKNDEISDLAKQYFEYKKRNLYYKRNSGEISNEELKERLKEQSEIPTKKDFKMMKNNLEQKYLTKESEKRITRRDSYSLAQLWEKNERQDINTTHKNSVYKHTQEHTNKVFAYGIGGFKYEGDEYLEHIADRIGEDYARGTTGEKAELAKQFAKLEIKGTRSEFRDPYIDDIVDGYNNPKLLLQLEKVSGLNVEELEETIGLNTSDLHQDIYVATYEIKEWVSELKEYVMKPIKEYYRKNENGEMTVIATGTEKNTSFEIDGFSIDVASDQIMQGETLEKVTQKEMADRLIKNMIEDSMKNGKITEVAQITDEIFLKNFQKQCGISQNWDLKGRTYIISTINDKGEEDFDIIVRYDMTNKELDTAYKHLMGINETKNKGRQMYTTKDIQLEGGLSILDEVQSLKEFETESGHKYAITRNEEGKLCFNEIFRENENIIQAEKVDTYSISNLKKAYESAKINEGDIKQSYETMNKTKEERIQKQNPTKGKGGEQI